MADFIFDAALGKEAYYAGLPAASDALIVVLLKSSGLEADSALRLYTDLATLLAASNDECTFTNYVRKSITSVTSTTDTTNHRFLADFVDQTYASAGGASNNDIGKLIIGYDNDTGAGTDSNIVPVAAYDCVRTTDGTNLQITLNPLGFLEVLAA